MSQVLERGDIFFVYRPRVQEDNVQGFDDVQRTYVVLRPRDKQLYRLILLGRKRMPKIDARERVWGFVRRVGRTADELKAELEPAQYQTRTRGARSLAAARPAGEGVYSIVRHDDHTHLAYVLELPPKPGRVQHDLQIEPEASYILSVRNPDAPAPPGVGLRDGRASYPEELRQRFGGRRFIPADPPELLDYEGAEILLIGASEDVEHELSIELDAERESLETAEIFKDLRLDTSNRPLEPLLTGDWR